MADNTTLNTGSGGDVVRTNDRSSVKTPVIMLDIGSDSTESVVDGTAAAPAALLPVGGKVAKLSATPTVTAGAYSANDAVGGKITFANAARVSGGSIVIETAVVGDKAVASPSLELWLFDADFTAASDNAAFDPDDADLANLIGIIDFSTWKAGADNEASVRSGLGMAAKLAGTSLFGQLVTRGTPTLASTSDIFVTLHVIQN